MFKLKLKGNENKNRIDSEIQNKLEYMAKIGPGDEYQDCITELEKLYELKDRMSIGHKLKEAFPWISLAITGTATVGVPLFLGLLAWTKNEDGELKEGDSWRLAINNVMKPKQNKDSTKE